MTTKKKVTLAITIPIAIILVAILCLVSIYGIDILKDKIARKGWTEIDYCNDRWDVQIPKATIEYTFSDRGGWFGDGETYTVCKYSTRPDEFLKDFKADIKVKNLNKYNEIIEHLQSSGIDTNKLIEPDENYIWLHKEQNSLDNLFLVYNQQTNTLYIVESLI